MGQHNGFFSLGQMIAGGDPTVGTPGNKQFLEGLTAGSTIRARQASTENALAQARIRRNEAEAQDEFKALSEELNIDPAFTAATRAGFDPRQFTGASTATRELELQNIIADVNVPFEQRQAAAQALQKQVVKPFQFGPGGELATDVFKPDLQVTETGTAQIALDAARADQATETARLREAQRKNPGAFKSSFILGGTDVDGKGLGDTILEDITASQIPADVQPSEATGVRGVFQSLSNIPFDIVNANLPFPETSIAENAMSQLAKRMTIVGQQAMPGRPNVKLIELLESFGVEPNDIARGDQRSIDLLRQTSRFLDIEVDSIRRQLNSGRVGTPGKVIEFEKGLRSLAGLQQDFNVIISRFDATQNQTSAGGVEFTLSDQ